ncbi:DHH family phosphoesterase [Candidatus Dojkabacteria bacterium]|uniref:DHH family phosphoesterase n=1 Tax=Candidatus Dojkabacteria bacterium TaxID=2099670 RepID=A0A955I293_9BACT|nr:DHH family phosphoesterase [Candidatus Dojkabacteria bacterium]
MSDTKPTVFKKNLIAALQKAKNVSITGHINPDYDALASAVAMKKYLDIAFPDVEKVVVFEGANSDEEPLFPEINEITWIDELQSGIADADVSIFVDGSPHVRFTHSPEKLDFTGKTTFCIDHHLNIPDHYDYILNDSNKSSCTQIIAELFFDKEQFKDKFLSELILFGILSDTGTFRYLEARHADALILVIEILKESDLNIQSLYQRLSTVSRECYKIFQELVRNTRFVKLANCKHGIMYSYLSNEMAAKYNDKTLRAARSLYLFNSHRNVRGYPWGFVVAPEKDTFSASFRSTPGALNLMPVIRHLGGGGVAMAGGITISKDNTRFKTEEIVQEIIDKLKSFDFSQSYLKS